MSIQVTLLMWIGRRNALWKFRFWMYMDWGMNKPLPLSIPLKNGTTRHEASLVEGMPMSGTNTKELAYFLTCILSLGIMDIEIINSNGITIFKFIVHPIINLFFNAEPRASA